MTTLRATVIMKTDLSGSTARFRALPGADVGAALSEHRQFVSRLAAAQDGRIVKPEGDGFWVVFPSVTAAALAAMAMQEELRLAQPNKGEDRLAMRIVITLGDVLHQDGALIGDAVVLAARVEAITPPDAIYLSAAAWLAVNQADVRTALVDAVTLKGFPEPVPVYRVEQTYRTRVIADQYVVITDLRGFSALVDRSPITAVEPILDQLFELINEVSREFGGTNLFVVGDSYCLTFPEPALTMAAAERLVESWAAFERQQGFQCPMNVAVHQGVMYAFRSYLYGRGLDTAGAVEGASRRAAPAGCSIFVTGEVRRNLLGSPWEKRLERVDVWPPSSRFAEVEVYRVADPDPASSPSGTGE
ncbi:MAG TPA: adenylate/guanylate cyclase domain-containing protein [Methylomirabilota bacterium]|jgi:class 3 adenylate cyclase|nr:adenylate/guanylate cyclase domain-containing protein [Methylomirabilota bacterium]